MDKMLVTFTYAEVIPIDYARRVLYAAGFGARREMLEGRDDLVVVESRTSYSLYVAKDAGPAEVGRLVVDEGVYSDTLKPDGRVGFNEPSEELVDAQGLWCLLARVLLGHRGQTSAIGRGRASRELMVQAVAALQGHSFVDEKKGQALEFAPISKEQTA